jgi:hypothetical protein
LLYNFCAGYPARDDQFKPTTRSVNACGYWLSLSSHSIEIEKPSRRGAAFPFYAASNDKTEKKKGKHEALRP